MTKKFKAIITLMVLLIAPFVILKAEPTPGSSNQGKIEDITSKVYPSVVKVEARNRIRKVATGVVIDKNGYIVTTALISPRDEKISVITSRGKKINAEFLGMDSETHLALIQAEDKSLVPITLGTSKELSPGSWIGVVSFSPENTPAITQGIVSSISQDRLRLNVWVVPGSSGSPVVNREGRMVGVLRGTLFDDKPVVFEFREKDIAGSGFVFSKAEAPSSGLAIAIPVDVVKSVTSEIKEKGRVARGWLGVSMGENKEGQAVITKVEKESPAELAKLKKGDIILELEGKDITRREMLRDEIRKRKPGESITLKIKRDGKIIEVKARLGEYTEKDMRLELESKFPRLFFPQPPKLSELPEPPKIGMFRWALENRRYIGVDLEELNEELSEYFGVKEGRGLLVSKVGEGMPAEKAGLRVGDVIIKADGVQVERKSELVELIQDKKKGDRIKIEFLRDRKKRSVEVEIEEEKRSGIFRYSSKDWEDYVDSWGKYSENLKKQYKIWVDRYKDNYEKQMKKWREELEKSTKKSQEATKKLLMSLKKYKLIRV